MSVKKRYIRHVTPSPPPLSKKEKKTTNTATILRFMLLL
jgi:hypothetical protein